MVKKQGNWAKPEMIVLVHNKPEEAVLDICKEVRTDGGPYNPNCKSQGSQKFCYPQSFS